MSETFVDERNEVVQVRVRAWEKGRLSDLIKRTRFVGRSFGFVLPVLSEGSICTIHIWMLSRLSGRVCIFETEFAPLGTRIPSRPREKE